MSGKPPFFGLSDVTIILRAMAGEFPKPEDHPGLPPTDPLWGLMRRCWDMSPTARPTMSEILCEVSPYVIAHLHVVTSCAFDFI